MGFEPMTSVIPVQRSGHSVSSKYTRSGDDSEYMKIHVERCTGIAEVMGSNPVQA